MRQGNVNNKNDTPRMQMCRVCTRYLNARIVNSMLTLHMTHTIEMPGNLER